MEEKKRSGWVTGCMIAGGIGAALALCCGGMIFYGGWSAWQNPDVRRGIQMVGAAAGIMTEAQRGPGTAELRGAGCVQAIVFTPELMRRLVEALSPDGGVDDVPQLTIVSCGVQAASPLTCETVARTYATAVSSRPGGPPDEMLVSVQVGQREQRCQGVYDATGTFLRPPGEAERSFGNMGRGAAPNGSLGPQNAPMPQNEPVPQNQPLPQNEPAPN